MQVLGVIGDHRQAGCHARAVLQAGGSPMRLAAARSVLAEVSPVLTVAGRRDTRTLVSPLHDGWRAAA